MSNKVNQMVTDQIIKQLESVDPSNYSTPWFCIGHSPVNIRGTAYRGINDILLSHSGFASNIWAAFKQWQEKTVRSKKGSARKSSVCGNSSMRPTRAAMAPARPAGGTVLSDSRRGKNTRHLLTGLLRQSLYGRLAGYEDVNDADRLSRDPAMRAVVDRRGLDR